MSRIFSRPVCFSLSQIKEHFVCYDYDPELDRVKVNHHAKHIYHFLSKITARIHRPTHTAYTKPTDTVSKVVDNNLVLSFMRLLRTFICVVR